MCPVSSQSCGPTACGNICSKEKASEASAVSTVICGVLSCAYLVAAYLYNWSQCPLVCPRVCAHLCLQGLSSHWSPWEVVGLSPNCPKDTGYGSSNNLQSGEIKIKETVCVLFLHCVAPLTIGKAVLLQLYFCLCFPEVEFCYAHVAILQQPQLKF